MKNARGEKSKKRARREVQKTREERSPKNAKSEKREERSTKNARREVRKISEKAIKREERNSKSARREVQETRGYIQVIKTGGEKKREERRTKSSKCVERSQKSARREVKIEARKLHLWATVLVLFSVSVRCDLRNSRSCPSCYSRSVFAVMCRERRLSDS